MIAIAHAIQRFQTAPPGATHVGRVDRRNGSVEPLDVDGFGASPGIVRG